MIGATWTGNAVFYRVWAPKFSSVAVEVHRDGKTRAIALSRAEGGYFIGEDPEGRPGDTYGYRLNEGDQILPDPASRALSGGVHGRSLVIDPAAFNWTDQGWRSPALRDLVVYELHIGTFTQAGTFLAAKDRLPYLRTLGITAIELMPLADFPGTRNWGYDGVQIYAPASCYGTPDDLRSLVDAAHGEGIAVILDVVYNHLGPDGNYLSAFSPYYFHSRHHTPWGNGFNFDADHCAPVREYFRANPGYWMDEFHIDGFRFDAAHEIQDDTTPHILAEMTDEIHKRGGFAIAEDDRNEARMLTPTSQGGMGFDGVWADDFHHSIRVTLTGENHSYLGNFTGGATEAGAVLEEGWLYHGQKAPVTGKPRGTPGGHLPPHQFVHCLSNHDQVGNRAFGDRISQVTSLSGYRAISMLLCLSPYTPMLFMGQEWAATSPFLFFTDHNEKLGKLVIEGRRKEFASFPEFADAETRERIPSPQDQETFLKSKLRWDEVEREPHALVLSLYRECLQLRRKEAAFRPCARDGYRTECEKDTLRILWTGSDTEWLLVTHLGEACEISPGGTWQSVLSSEEIRFGGIRTAHSEVEALQFRGPESILLKRSLPGTRTK
ncbi:malto-oligosyltrehalose trehalohydrolase [Terrimicrobium sacchariphilum]|nr:malto-oligosyltrehalose trehalohydrolase [Terrimicrobium sacchariphilum]